MCIYIYIYIVHVCICRLKHHTICSYFLYFFKILCNRQLPSCYASAKKERMHKCHYLMSPMFLPFLPIFSFSQTNDN